MKKLVAAMSVFLGLTALSLSLEARPGKGGDHDFLDRLEFIADRIGLTDQQEADINSIINSSQLTNAVDRERAVQIKDELHGLTENFDASQAQILADEMGEITARLVYTKAETQAAVQAVFTAEQKEMLQAMREEREKMRAVFGERGHGGFEGRSGEGGRGGIPRHPDGQ